eukprot:366102-Chlamydomonas_euryale.AAC.11
MRLEHESGEADIPLPSTWPLAKLCVHFHTAVMCCQNTRVCISDPHIYSSWPRTSVLLPAHRPDRYVPLFGTDTCNCRLLVCFAADGVFGRCLNVLALRGATKACCPPSPSFQTERERRNAFAESVGAGEHAVAPLYPMNVFLRRRAAKAYRSPPPPNPKPGGTNLGEALGQGSMPLA